MTTDAVTIRWATIEDAADIAALGARVFRRTFSDDPEHHPDDMDLFVGQTHIPSAVAANLADPATCYLLAVTSAPASHLVAFVKLLTGPAPECVPGRRPLEIGQFYVDFDWHGRGVAATLMERSLAHARAGQHDTLWLGVWHRNHRAQRFYRKWGFERVGDHPFQFGRAAQTDEVFARPLDADDSADRT